MLSHMCLPVFQTHQALSCLRTTIHAVYTVWNCLEKFVLFQIIIGTHLKCQLRERGLPCKSNLKQSPLLVSLTVYCSFPYKTPLFVIIYLIVCLLIFLSTVLNCEFHEAENHIYFLHHLGTVDLARISPKCSLNGCLVHWAISLAIELHRHWV